MDAQKRMNTIRIAGRGIVSDSGTLSYIIGLLEDEEDAKDNLRDQIARLEKTTSNCKEEADAITAKFDYWLRVIITLKQIFLAKKGKRGTST